jgi:hypothetical protein
MSFFYYIIIAYFEEFVKGIFLQSELIFLAYHYRFKSIVFIKVKT